ncbi:MAG: hypothetical protein WAT39_22395 [Planctomycetota bacterium]
MPSGPAPGQPTAATAAVRGQLLRFAVVLPAVAMAASLSGLAWFCRDLLADAAAGRAAVVGGAGFWSAIGGFLLAVGGLVVLQSMRLANRVAGPEYRLRRALQQVRAGDVGARVTLRSGDLLTGLAAECNALLDWVAAGAPGVSQPPAPKAVTGAGEREPSA